MAHIYKLTAEEDLRYNIAGEPHLPLKKGQSITILGDVLDRLRTANKANKQAKIRLEKI